jgi:carboxypeptidase Taq
VPDWRSQLAQGNLKGINGWLNQNIHCEGNLFDPQDLIRKVSGSNIDSEAYLQYLREKYGELYGF